MNCENLLPIGTVVQIKESPSWVMVIGYYPIDKKTERTFTYLGTVYPVGLGISNQAMMLDHESIEKIQFEPTQSDEAASYCSSLKTLVEEKLAEQTL